MEDLEKTKKEVIDFLFDFLNAYIRIYDKSNVSNQHDKIVMDMKKRDMMFNDPIFNRSVYHLTYKIVGRNDLFLVPIKKGENEI